MKFSLALLAAVSLAAASPIAVAENANEIEARGRIGWYKCQPNCDSKLKARRIGWWKTHGGATDNPNGNTKRFNPGWWKHHGGSTDNPDGGDDGDDSGDSDDGSSWFNNFAL